jgi:hypothetical protein
MSKYLTREQVLSQFNLTLRDVLKDMSDGDIEFLWEKNLDMMAENKEISEKQRETWVFNINEIKK